MGTQLPILLIIGQEIISNNKNWLSIIIEVVLKYAVISQKIRAGTLI